MAKKTNKSPKAKEELFIINFNYGQTKVSLNIPASQFKEAIEVMSKALNQAGVKSTVTT